MASTKHSRDNSQSSDLVANSIEFELNDESWQKIWEDITPFWQKNPHYINAKYTKFAELFEKLEVRKIALIFSHISQGVLSHQKFSLLTENSSKSRIEVYGVVVKGEESFSDRVSNSIDWIKYYLFLEDPSANNLQQQKMRRFLTFGMVGLSFIGGIAFGNTGLIRLPFLYRGDKSSTHVEPLSKKDDLDSGWETSVTPIDKNLVEQKKKLAKNIIVIDGLRKILEKERDNPNAFTTYPSRFKLSDVTEEILSQFNFTLAQNQKNKLSQILRDIADKTPGNAMEYIEKEKLSDWKKLDIQVVLTVIKEKIKSRTNDDLMLAEGRTINEVKAKILDSWKKPN
jgi:hypothetical protein